jgi:hypothetical protein
MHYLLVTDDKGTRIMCEGKREHLEDIAMGLRKRRPSLIVTVSDRLDDPPLPALDNAGLRADAAQRVTERRNTPSSGTTPGL